MELGPGDDVAVPVNMQNSQFDPLCYSWSEVKLHRLTNSELERYLGRVDSHPKQDKCMKGDNTEISSPQRTADLRSPPSDPLLSCSGRPRRKAVSGQSYVESPGTDSSRDDDGLKVDNNENQSRPRSSGPSKARMAAQHSHTALPLMGLKLIKYYKRSSSPVYSVNSKESSACSSDASGLDSDMDTDGTFEGFAPLSQKQLDTLDKLGRLKTTKYGLKLRKRK